jgi:hypothetical protein
MCDPLTATAAVVGGAGVAKSIMGFIGTQAAHHVAVQTANLNYAAKDEQTQRENALVSGQQANTNLTDAVAQAQSMGRIATSAASLGLGQYSSHQLLAADATAYNRRMGIEDANYDNKRANIQTELEGASLTRSSAIAQAPKANLGTLALSLAGNAADAATTYGSLGGKFGIQPVGGAPKA